MRHVLATTLASLMLLAPLSPALAQDTGLKIANPKGIIDNASPENMIALLSDMGVTGAQVQENEGTKIVTFSDGALPYAFGFAGCEVKPGKCMTVVMLVFVDMGNAGITPDMINARNSDNFFVTSVKTDEKTIAFGRGVLLNGGITRENMALNIVVYASLVREGIKHFNAQVVAARNVPATVQNLSWGQGQVRPILPTPQQIRAVMKAQDFQPRASGSLGATW